MTCLLCRPVIVNAYFFVALELLSIYCSKFLLTQRPEYFADLLY